MAERIPSTLLAPLGDLAKWLDATRTQAIVVGGVAVSLLGRPRFTKDIDALVILAEQEWEAALTAAPMYGLVARIEQPLEFARRTRVLLLRHVESDIDIDIILGALPFEQNAVEHGQTHDVEGVNVRLPRVEDLLIMKAVAHRPRDMQDIDNLLKLHPEANTEFVKQWVREFARATAMSDLADDFERLVARHRSDQDAE